MARHSRSRSRSHKHRKSHRKSHSKSQRKSQRKSHRKSHRRSQRGGASCAAQPLFNRSVFDQQGGMAPIAAGDAYLIDAASRVQAQTAPLDSAIAELPAVIPRQAGGRRRHTVHARKAHRKSHSKRKSHRKSHRRSSRRAQKGGALAEFRAPYDLGVDIMKTNPNPQFLEYLPAKGAQAL